MSILRGDQKQLPHNTNIVNFFEESLSREEYLPKNGLYYNDKFMEYKLLNERAACLAANLESMIIKYYKAVQNRPQPVFGIDITSSFELIIAYISVLKLGGIIVPIDSNAAINRMKNIINKCQPCCVIVDANSTFLEETTDKLWSTLHIYDIGKTDWSKDGSKWSFTQRKDDDIAAILFTSGSTGVPKGVQITHKGLLNRLLFEWDAYPFEKHEVCCYKTSILFVDSLLEIFSVILKLISLVIVPTLDRMKTDKLVNLIEHHQVTRLRLVPSLLRYILFFITDNSESNPLPTVQLWISCSEKLSVDLLINFFHIFSNRKLLNFYGSTETMGDVSHEIYENESDILLKQCDGNLSIGRPMMNNNIYILDENGSLLPEGSVGEICVSGANINSYIDKRSEFRSNDLLETPGHSLIYCTGDYGKISNGMLIYESRRDLQVKIGGNRVNISEIEKVVIECDNVKQVVILCHKLVDIVTMIVAFYVITEKTNVENCDVESEIMDACRKNLPPYMRPKLFCVSEIPLLTHSGKIDKHCLKEMYESSFKEQSAIDLKKLDDKAQKVLNIIGMYLNIPASAIPHKASFSQLGGNSITLMAIMVQLRQIGLYLPMYKIIECSTIQEMIENVTEVQPLNEQPVSTGYTVRCLNDITNPEDTIDILIDSVLTKHHLEILLGITKEEILSFANSLYKIAIKSGMSFVVIDDVTGDVVAGNYMCNLEDRNERIYHPSLKPIVALLKDFEDPIVEQVKKDVKGPLICNIALFVRKDLDYSEQVKLCYLIESNVLTVAESHGFVGVLTNNTNQVTQDICEHFFGYQLLSKFRVADFVFNDRQVFSHAPKDYFIKMMLKNL